MLILDQIQLVMSGIYNRKMPAGYWMWLFHLPSPMGNYQKIPPGLILYSPPLYLVIYIIGPGYVKSSMGWLLHANFVPCTPFPPPSLVSRYFFIYMIPFTFHRHSKLFRLCWHLTLFLLPLLSPPGQEPSPFLHPSSPDTFSFTWFHSPFTAILSSSGYVDTSHFSSSLCCHLQVKSPQKVKLSSLF